MDTKEKQWKWKLVEQIDLRTVVEKLKDKKSWWWNLWADTGKLESEYRQFLYLIATNPGKTVVPWSQDIDDLWHEHILDTKKYAHDCENVFGQYIHHNPHLPQGTYEYSKAYSDTKKMYKEAFEDRKKNKKEKVEGTSTYVDSPGCGSCFIAVFCGSSCGSHSHAGCGDHGGSHCSSGSTSDGGGGSSCSSSSCSGGSSCGSSCGGGGCGGGGD